MLIQEGKECVLLCQGLTDVSLEQIERTNVIYIHVTCHIYTYICHIYKQGKHTVWIFHIHEVPRKVKFIETVRGMIYKNLQGAGMELCQLSWTCFSYCLFFFLSSRCAHVSIAPTVPAHPKDGLKLLFCRMKECWITEMGDSDGCATFT